MAKYNPNDVVIARTSGHILTILGSFTSNGQTRYHCRYWCDDSPHDYSYHYQGSFDEYALLGIGEALPKPDEMLRAVKEIVQEDHNPLYRIECLLQPKRVIKALPIFPVKSIVRVNNKDWLEGTVCWVDYDWMLETYQYQVRFSEHPNDVSLFIAENDLALVGP